MVATPFLVKLMDADGVKFSGRSGQEWMAYCWAHKDDTPSMSVNVAKGVYHCFGCGISGNEYNYLHDVRGYSSVDAAQYMKDEGRWSDEKTDWTIQKGIERDEELERNKSGFPSHSDRVPQKMHHMPMVSEYDYRNSNGQLVFKVVKYGALKDGKVKKTFMQLTPAKQGGWWLCNPLKDNLPGEDKRVDLLPLYQLGDLLKTERRQVWFVEGEKCADMVRQTEMKKESARPYATCMAGGCKANFKLTDFSPLRGRSVVFIADADAAGRDFMVRLGKYLTHHYEVKARFVLPKGDNGYDIADALAEGGFKGTMEWIKSAASDPGMLKKGDFIPAPPTDGSFIDPDAEVPPPDDFFCDTEHFKIMGITADGLGVVFFRKKTNTTLKIKSTTLMQDGQLIQLAPIEWWRDMCGKDGYGQQTKLKIASDLLRSAEDMGVVADMTPKGRGCVRTETGGLVFNLGDRCFDGIVNGKFTTTVQLDQSPVLLDPGIRIEIENDLTNAKRYARDLYASMMAYRFDSSIDARRFLGWMVSSILGGCLDHRPNVWLSSPAKTGKTFLISSVLEPFFGNLMRSFADPTPAGLAQRVRNDSIPVVIDEFEPEERNEKIWREVLSLLRASTGGNSERVRGTQWGEAIGTSPRFSAMVVSISRPRLAEADDSRMVACKLSPVGVDNWGDVKSNIIKATQTHKMNVLRSAIIQRAPLIIRQIEKLKDKWKYDGYDQRELLIHSALTAGAGFLSGDYETTWRPDTDTHEEQEYALVTFILGCIVNFAVGSSETLANLLLSSQSPDDAYAGPTCERYGLKLWYDEVKDDKALLVSYTSPELINLLRTKNSRARNFDLRLHLEQMEGTYYPMGKKGTQYRGQFGGIRRVCIAIGSQTLSLAGLELS